MFQDRCYERDIDINNNFYAENMSNDIDMNYMNNANMDMNQNYQTDSCCQQPIVEPMQEKCVHRTIMHEVPHVCPIRTKVINHHVYRHTYRPEYSCCEENVVSNIDNGSCCNFR
jgi:hypothetical protein